MMDTSVEGEESVLDYILQRRCSCGGFCFYRLDEPCAQDTYYALSSLSLLGRRVRDPKTEAFLRSLRDENGCYQSISTCFYCVMSLELLGSSEYGVSEGYLKAEEAALVNTLCSNRFSMDLFLEHAHQFFEVAGLLRFDVGSDLSSRLSLLSPPPYLKEIYHYVRSCELCGVGYDGDYIREFLRACQDPHVGFREAPQLRLSYLEQLYYGVRLCEILGDMPLYPDGIKAFVLSCRRANGGYARCSAGIATLKDTYYAVYILNRLARWLC